MLWYVIFFVIALKIPTVWLCWVVWWAIKAKPDHESGDTSGGFGGSSSGDGGPSWWKPGGRARPGRERLSRRNGPHGVPPRRPTRVGVAHAERADPKETR